MNYELVKKLKNMTPGDFYKIINNDDNNEIKDWLAKLGSYRIDEIFDPSLILERAINTWRVMGYRDEWIRNKLIEIVDKTSKQ